MIITNSKYLEANSKVKSKFRDIFENARYMLQNKTQVEIVYFRLHFNVIVRQNDEQIATCRHQRYIYIFLFVLDQDSTLHLVYLAVR